MQNWVKKGEISSEEVEKIEAEYGGGYLYLVKVVVRPYTNSDELVDWWHVHREADTFSRRMVAHAPTKELAMEQLEELKGSQWHSFKSICWSLPWEEQKKCHEIEAKLKKIKNQEKIEKAQQELLEAGKKKHLAAARQNRYKERKKQKERVELVKKVGETDRFTGLEI